MKRQHELQKEIVVIGGGAGGCQAALMLAKVHLKDEKGHYVRDVNRNIIPKYLITILEAKENILDGASAAAAQEHLGGEYPVDLATALDCLKAAIIKKLTMPEGIYSKVPPKQFLIDEATDNLGREKITRAQRVEAGEIAVASEEERADFIKKGGEAITVDRFEAHYEKIRQAYKEIFKQVQLAKGWSTEETEKRLFGSYEEGKFFRRLDPSEYADHQGIAGGFQTPEIGLNVPRYLATIDTQIRKTPNIEVRTNSKVYKDGTERKEGEEKFTVVYEEKQKNGTFKEKRIRASQVVQAAWEGGMEIMPKLQNETDADGKTIELDDKVRHEVTVYKRGIMTLNLPKGWNKGGVFIMQDQDLVKECPNVQPYCNGGMLAPYNDQISAHSLLSLINDLLDIAKIETNSIELEHVVLNLDKIIQEIAAIFSTQAKEKGIALVYSESVPSLPLFLGDPLRIKQILMNLVSNAMKFTQKGSITINLTASPHSESNQSYVHISVKDTGIGIPLERQRNIFDKFIQADMSITRKYGGTGLGLSISKNLAELMGGGITVNSAPGQGSEFALHIPLECVTHSQAQGKMPARRNLELVKPVDRGTLLLVEDYDANILVATTILEEMGYRCDVASNGKEAIHKIQQHRDKYKVVLMDVQMPIMDGYAATRLVREEEKKHGHPPIPIIGVTAHALSGDMEKCLEAGMDDYISKPFNQELLLAKIERLSNRQFEAA